MGIKAAMSKRVQKVVAKGKGQLTGWPGFNSLLALDLPKPFMPRSKIKFTVTLLKRKERRK